MLSSVKRLYTPSQNTPSPIETLQAVDTINHLRQLDISTIAESDAVYVKGYYQPGDHGGGMFV